MKLKLTLNGFHGFETHAVRGEIAEEIGGKDGETPGYRVEISAAGAKKFRCTAKDCKCGEQIPQSFWVRADRVNGNAVEYRGQYPQR